MKKYVLKNTSGEVINTLNADNLIEAEVLFSKRKGLTTEQLIKIYIVEEEK